MHINFDAYMTMFQISDLWSVDLIILKLSLNSLENVLMYSHIFCGLNLKYQLTVPIWNNHRCLFNYLCNRILRINYRKFLYGEPLLIYYYKFYKYD